MPEDTAIMSENQIITGVPLGCHRVVHAGAWHDRERAYNDE